MISTTSKRRRTDRELIPDFATHDFHLPPELEASEPPEARGLARDAVRLMVSHRAGDRVTHARFRDLPAFLDPGDVVAINTSGTRNAAIPAARADGTPLELRLSTHLPADLWSVELRRPDGAATQPFFDARPGETLRLPAGASVTLHAPYARSSGDARVTIPRADSLWTAAGAPKGPREGSRGLASAPPPGHGASSSGAPAGRPEPPPELDSGIAAPPRLWIATLDLPGPLDEYLEQHAFPIRYGYVRQGWPNAYYQNVYVTEIGSAEMPSAGRAFTPELITRLVARGVHVTPLLLHTGVASLEEPEPPYEEFYRVPIETARLVNTARAAGRRVLAVGTTAVRALETVTDAEGVTHPGEGWTRLVITPERGLRAVNALLTGLHEPRATHLAMLEALAGRRHLELTYAEALRERYLWHEFGDLHLML
jgi:S-adenosylmethionine:tRNA ribosyltransferase-isomerase